MKKIAGGLFAIILALGLTLSVAAPAQAAGFGKEELHQACRLANYGSNVGSVAWQATLTYPNQGVYGWRCFYNNAPWAEIYNTKYSMNVQLICNQIDGTASFTKQSDPYSWYCG